MNDLQKTNINPEEKLKITFYTPVTDERSQVIAIFGCYAVNDDIYFSKCKLIRKKDGGLFVAMPSEKYTDPKTGQDAFQNFCWYGTKKAQFFQELALESIKSYCLRKQLPHPSIVDPGPKEVANSAFGTTVPYPNATFTGF